MKTNIDQLLTQSDLAEWLQVSEWTIWAMRRRDELPPAVRVGKMLRWRLETLEIWLQQREIPSSEFDSVLCNRAEKCVEAKERNRKGTFSEQKKRRGRPTKVSQMESKV